MNSFNLGPDGSFTLVPEFGTPARDAPERRAPLLTQYVQIAFRRKWIILVSLVIALLGSILYTLLATPRYTATAQIEVKREGAKILSNVTNVEPETTAGDQEFYQTQYTILRSRSMADRVAKDLRLADNPAFFTAAGADDIASGFTGASGAAATPRGMRADAAAQLLLKSVTIEPIRTSRLVNISYTSTDPDQARQIANAWAQSFIQYNLERRFDATSYARRFLEGRLEQLRGRLEQSERLLVGYASQQALINIPVAGGGAGGNGTQERSLTVDSLAALNVALSEATADRVKAESRLQGSSAVLPEQLNNATIAGLRTQRAQANAAYAKLMTQFSPQYPPAAAQAAEIKRLDESIAREEQRVRSSVQNAFGDSQDRERRLRGEVNRLRTQFLDQRRRSIQYNIFQRDVDTNRELYNGLLQRYKEIGVAGGVGENNISVVDSADRPTAPSAPRPLLNIVLALMLGTVIGVAAAFAREQMDETIVDPLDVERRIGLPLLGAVPISQDVDPLVNLQDPKSPLTDAYLSIQTSLSFSTDHGVPRSLVVTSSGPAEGKSITSYALAMTLARSGVSVLLIDADMRSPSVHTELRIDNERGLSTYLSGTMPLEQAIQRPVDSPFDVMTAGPQPPNAAELLRGSRLAEMLTELGDRYRHVVIDAPPVMGLADAPILASHAEGTVVVLEARGVRIRVALNAMDRLRQSRARILGGIMTKLPQRGSAYAYGYDHGYGYEYGKRQAS